MLTQHLRHIVFCSIVSEMWVNIPRLCVKELVAVEIINMNFPLLYSISFCFTCDTPEKKKYGNPHIQANKEKNKIRENYGR